MVGIFQKEATVSQKWLQKQKRKVKEQIKTDFEEPNLGMIMPRKNKKRETDFEESNLERILS